MVKHSSKELCFLPSPAPAGALALEGARAAGANGDEQTERAEYNPEQWDALRAAIHAPDAPNSEPQLSASIEAAWQSLDVDVQHAIDAEVDAYSPSTDQARWRLRSAAIARQSSPDPATEAAHV